MNITTRHTSNANGRGGVIATGTVSGRRRQTTTAWDHAISADKNHARAAAQYVQRFLPESTWNRIAFNTTHKYNEDQSHTWHLL